MGTQLLKNRRLGHPKTAKMTKKVTNAAKALMKNTNMDAKQVALESLNIAADICIYTNHNIISETIEL